MDKRDEWDKSPVRESLWTRSRVLSLEKTSTLRWSPKVNPRGVGERVGEIVRSKRLSVFATVWGKRDFNRKGVSHYESLSLNKDPLFSRNLKPSPPLGTKRPEDDSNLLSASNNMNFLLQVPNIVEWRGPGDFLLPPNKGKSIRVLTSQKDPTPLKSKVWSFCPFDPG